MFKRKQENINVSRVNAEPTEGLNDEQVNERISARLVNVTKMIAGKTYWEILRTDVLTFFNNLLFIIAGFMIFSNVNDGKPQTKWFTGLFFVLILLANIGIGLYQDLKAKHLMTKLRVITTPTAKVVRGGNVLEIKPEQIVLDDILILQAGDQIPSDSILLTGDIFVNESMLTGESRNVEKKEGDTLFSGSYLTSGTCYARVVKVGKENYIETLTEKAKSFKRNPSHILRSLKVLFRYLGIIIICFAVTIVVAYAALGKFNSVENFALSVRPIAGQMVAMIPAGLYLLTSFTLASGVLSLYQKKANVQDFYSIEMLARSDVICVDKTGTITDGNLSVKKVDCLSKTSEEEIASIILSLVEATKDENVTAKALRKHFELAPTFTASRVLPFTSDNKYSGISTELGITYIIGALEFMNVKNKDVLLKESEEYTSKGYRLLTLAKGKSEIKGDKYSEELEAIAFVILQDHIKEDALKTFSWFQENHVQVRVISGDNALTVSEIARLAGIEGAEKFISLEGRSLEEVRDLANDYVVFGRVTPEQKETLIMALKEAGHTVAMVGDGINDMLALKRADCSIAMNSGSLSAKNVSHVVLMDDNFSTMPSVVAEGRRVINNLQRTGSLFLTKTFFAMALSLPFLVLTLSTLGDFVYPFSTSNMFLWEVFNIGLAAFFIALEPDNKPINHGFLRNIMKKAFPNVAIILASTLLCYLLFVLQNNEVMHTGVYDFGADPFNTAVGRSGAAGMAVICFSVLSLFVLYLTCRPLSIYRGVVVGTTLVVDAGLIILCNYLGEPNIFNVNFDLLTGENWMAMGVIAAICIIVALFVYSMVDVYKKYFLRKKEKNK